MAFEHMLMRIGAGQSRPNTMPAASFSPTRAKIATTARWLATGPTCSPTPHTGPMSRLTRIEPVGQRASSRAQPDIVLLRDCELSLIRVVASAIGFNAAAVLSGRSITVDGEAVLLR